MVGNDTPTGPFHLKELQRVSMTLEMASGRAGFGVGMSSAYALIEKEL